MKKLFIFIFIITFYNSVAQQQGVMNTYTYYSREDKTNFNNNIEGRFKNELFFCSYFGQLNTIDNISENYDTTLSNMQFAFYEKLDNNKIILSTFSKIKIIQNNKVLFDTNYNANNEILNSLVVENDSSIFFTTIKNNKYSLFVLENNKMIKKMESNYEILLNKIFHYNCQYNYFYQITKDSILYYEIKNRSFNKIKSFTKPIAKQYIFPFCFDSSNNIIFGKLTNKESCIDIDFLSNKNNIKGDIKNVVLNNLNSENECLINPINDIFSFQNVISKQKNYFLYGGHINNFQYMPSQKAYYITTDNNTYKAFTYIYKYPKLFNQSNSNSVFTMQQDAQKNIWFGSYQGLISKLDSSHQVHQMPYFLQAMNGSLAINDNVYFIQEGEKGIYIINKKNTKTIIKGTENSTGFYLYKAKNNIIYYGTSEKGLWYITQKDLLANNGNWHKINKNKIEGINNVIGITEDSLGRIWFGKGRSGFAVWNPKTDSMQLQIMTNNKCKVGIFSTLTDNKGTVWIGTAMDGLYYYNAYNQNINILDLKKIKHCLLPANTKISAMCIWQNYLVLNAFNKTLLLDLDSFYHQKINIKYLTKQETNFTSFTEQNTMLVAYDSTIWFSTSDMVYQWKIKDWLQLPKIKITLNTILSTNVQTDTLYNQKNIKLSAKQNNFEINLNYSSEDKLPRYITTAMQFENDSIVWSEPSTNINFNYKNLKAGKYTFYVQVAELDGTESNYKYLIVVDSYWFQKWWVLALIGLAILSAVVFFITLRNQKKLAYQKLKSTVAINQKNEADLRNQLSQLQAIAISNQLRPHFLLNTLNQIGAYITNNPKAESIISRLGNSIDIIFNHSTTKLNAHSLKQEMKLVQNIVAIHQLMYLKSLQFIVTNSNLLDNYTSLLIPFGLVQIPIENALLHGLNNKQIEPYILSIDFELKNNCIEITIIDNGIGRTASAKLSNARKHGTGLKNMDSLIQLLNKNNSEQIKINFEDNIYNENNILFGTKVIIQLPLNYKYDFN